MNLGGTLYANGRDGCAGDGRTRRSAGGPHYAGLGGSHIDTRAKMNLATPARRMRRRMRGGGCTRRSPRSHWLQLGGSHTSTLHAKSLPAELEPTCLRSLTSRPFKSS